ncbi:creatininase family protein [Candidatus Bathyarchaeota archaeon]|nr:creatininase family protein [Candidatus Bathyarchaeota archaeon]
MNNQVWFAELTMQEVKEAAKADKVIIIPFGSVEEHGSHLPLCTDSIQPEYVAVEAAKRTGSLVAPPLKYGVCTTTRFFPGTISISFHSLYRLTVEILEEFIRNGFKRFLLLSGHAEEEQMTALKLAAYNVMRRHMEEARIGKLRIMVCSDYDFAYEFRGKYFSELDGHGGTIETSRVMAIRSDLVKGKGSKNFQQLPRFEVTVEPMKFWPEGIRGDPAEASAEKGRFLNDHIINELVKLIDELKSRRH